MYVRTYTSSLVGIGAGPVSRSRIQRVLYREIGRSVATYRQQERSCARKRPRRKGSGSPCFLTLVAVWILGNHLSSSLPRAQVLLYPLRAFGDLADLTRRQSPPVEPSLPKMPVNLAIDVICSKWDANELKLESLMSEEHGEKQKGNPPSKEIAQPKMMKQYDTSFLIF
ncbi:hypothetical protein GGS23DRAFT_167100 [Durotheca rogersii]|uniref:uncharacterized protein n=1 Tax=Durotheca rogersii TaxID=419775 RepID=UPI002220B27D|nr:uncharacterized protein GGS23DRAFT_167100 [Durotheca rogersii]KAI5867234.1 hypothetical protein GGS23DRAFT_167100 [Durotheca rogersii]